LHIHKVLLYQLLLEPLDFGQSGGIVAWLLASVEASLLVDTSGCRTASSASAFGFRL